MATDEVRQPAPILGERFEIDSVAGSGGMSTVFRARDRHSGRWVALKVLQNRSPGSHEAGRFVREAHVLAELQHPGIVGYVDHGVTRDGLTFLAMEWLEGEDLAARLARGPLSIGESILLARQLAAALQLAHQRGIVHRDIKPSNLFLRGGSIERVALLDFGVARHTLSLRPMTETGAVVGTPEYMAPEQARGQRDIGPAADIFSLGCVLYECLTGRPPFVGEHFAALLARILFDDAAPVGSLRPGVPPEFEALIDRMLEKEALSRPRDAGELLDALHHIAPDESEAPLPPSQRQPLGLTDSELQLVSVVVATDSSPADSSVATLDSAAGGQDLEQRKAITQLLSGFHAHLEWLADGSLCATLARPDSATDQVVQAARMALSLRERWPAAMIALATGSGRFREHLPVGEAIDRAVQLLRWNDRHTSQRLGASGGVWLDSLSADLLDGRFSILTRDGGQLLTGECASSDESRLLLGKPTPCVGREQELAFLDTILASTLDEPAAHAVLVLAAPGMGKSRLRHEFLRRLGGRSTQVEILFGRGELMSAGATYGLLGEALRRLFDLGPQRVQDGPASEREQVDARQKLYQRVSQTVPPGEAARVAAFLCELCAVPLPDEQSVQLRAARSDPKVMSDQVSRAFVDFLAAETARQPVLLVLEDLHWGDPLSVRLVDEALRELADRPLMVLAMGRPNVSVMFPRIWAGRVQEMHLRGLGKRASERLAMQILGPQFDHGLIAQIVAQADGNALFLEELIRAVASGKRDALPETVLAMLQARLQRLDPGARRVLRAASIYGQTFWRNGLLALHGQRLTPVELETWLSLLVESELIELHRDSRFPGDPQYGFRHALVRDAAYSMLPEEDRRVGHRLAARFLVEAGQALADPMLVARHFHLGGEATSAVPYYIRGAEQALASNDLGETLERVQQGISCITPARAGGGKSEPSGALAESLGMLQGLGCSAHFWCDDFAAGYPLGCAALKVLAPGSLRWMQTLGHMLTITSLTGRMQHFGELVEAFSAVQPSPEARGIYVEAASLLVSMFSFGGAREPARGFLGLMQQQAAAIFAEDPLALGWLKQAHTIYMLMLEADPLATCQLAQEGLRAAKLASARRMQALMGGFLGMAHALLGDHVESEALLRDNLALAHRLGEPMTITHAKAWLAASLATRGTPPALAEAHGLAQDILGTKGTNFFYTGGAHHVVARYRLGLGELAEAEAAASQAAECLQTLPILRCHALATHLTILRQANRLEEAMALCSQGEGLLQQLGCASYAEVPLRVSIAETYLAIDDQVAADAALAAARAALSLRMAPMTDDGMRQRFQTAQPEHVRLAELTAEQSHQTLDGT